MTVALGGTNQEVATGLDNFVINMTDFLNEDIIVLGRQTDGLSAGRHSTLYNMGQGLSGSYQVPASTVLKVLGWGFINTGTALQSIAVGYGDDNIGKDSVADFSNSVGLLDPGAAMATSIVARYTPTGDGDNRAGFILGHVPASKYVGIAHGAIGANSFFCLFGKEVAA